MKTFSTLKITTVILAAALLFSCNLNNTGDMGTLVIHLPGESASRVAESDISNEFKNTLSYLIECNGPGSVSQEFKSGGTVSLPLDAGRWTVKITVLNAAKQDIGKGETAVNIESGKTTDISIPVNIDISRCDITEFKLLFNLPAPFGTITLEAGINQNTRMISFNVSENILNLLHDNGIPVNNNSPFSCKFSAIHTGLSIEDPYGEEITLELGTEPKPITVKAENGGTKDYYLSFKKQDNEGQIHYTEWSGENDGSIPWTDFGFSSSPEKPDGTGTFFADKMGSTVLYVKLNVNVNDYMKDAFGSLVNFFDDEGFTEEKTAVFGNIFRDYVPESLPDIILAKETQMVLPLIAMYQFDDYILVIVLSY